MSYATATVRPVAAAPAAGGADLALLIGRILLVAIFPISGYYKLVVNGHAGTATYLGGLLGGLLGDGAVPYAGIAAWLAIAAELVLPLLVILGLFTRLALVGLIVYTLCTSALAHRFWEFSPPAQFNQIMSFMKNLCMVGGMLIVVAIGPGRFALTR